LKEEQHKRRDQKKKTKNKQHAIALEGESDRSDLAAQVLGLLDEDGLGVDTLEVQELQEKRERGRQKKES
jgi:hypothetical protein